MNDLITIKQVQDFLQIDRITVYRMLKDGRLSGFKVGKQWRIQRSEINRLLHGATHGIEQDKYTDLTPEEALPVHCVQVIQDIFADMLNISSVTIDLEGNRITEFSNTCEFCELIQQSKAGKKACQQSWKEIGSTVNGKFNSSTCHAGLNYTSCKIELFEQLLAIQIGGQFVTSEETKSIIKNNCTDLASRFDLDASELESAVESISVITPAFAPQIITWLEKVANTFEIIAYERAELLGRLNEIASISTFKSKGDYLSQ